MRLIQIQTATAVFNVDADHPKLCRSFDEDCAHVLDFDFCALYEPEEGHCPFVGEEKTTA